MTSFISTLKNAASKRAAYNRTVAEIESMPLSVALDLGIYKGDAHRIAQRAIYGS
jgi:hypothetical protein